LGEQMTSLQHNERCRKCKKTIEIMLREIYGRVQPDYKFGVGTRPQDFIGFPCYEALKEIFATLQNYRGYKDFVKSKVLPRVDFFMPDAGFIAEFDESQHFTIPRKLSLECYPHDLKLGFGKGKWMCLCDEIRAKDNDPPFRDEQRAWYDTLRDFVPEIKRLNATVRLYSKEIQWCSLDLKNFDDIEEFKNLIEGGKDSVKR